MTPSPSSPRQPTESDESWQARRSAFFETLSAQEQATVGVPTGPCLWPFWARAKQLPPFGDWLTWLVMGGRGAGKTRTGAEWIIDQARTHAKEARIHIVGRTASDVHGVMLYGESGIMEKSQPWFRPTHNPSKRQLTWPNGAIAKTFSADEPDSLRGPQSTHAWADEPAAWRFPDAWDQLMFGLRLGAKPRIVATTTPRATEFIRKLAKKATTIVTRESTYANLENLAPTFKEQILTAYEGTRLGRQEIDGDILDDAAGALFKRKLIDDERVTPSEAERAKKHLAAFIEARGIFRIAVAVDPAFSTSEEADETGIVVVGVDRRGHGYVLEDLSGKYSLAEWSRIVVQAYRDYRADRVVAEMNLNGQMVEGTLRSIDRNISFRGVRAYKAKELRAEPVASLYEQGKVHHVGSLAKLEDQMCSWVPGEKMKSPDRLDALVYGLVELMIDHGANVGAKAPSVETSADYDSRAIG